MTLLLAARYLPLPAAIWGGRLAAFTWLAKAEAASKLAMAAKLFMAVSFGLGGSAAR
ncbi:hypothetical protein [Pseudomonas sp. UBA2684]|uniref:hypothetical protein n=1 Tax=Pseudomonas sp. UBA2684 TaxID=1947311 RepID=UPI0025D81FD2|nr:hypothetical protein [Pseudomonas sp. UBA2684]|tara:strand:- start:26386 stop:26556 length:171 start_codon:yes stop_codon:yes gene_type:complete